MFLLVRCTMLLLSTFTINFKATSCHLRLLTAPEKYQNVTHKIDTKVVTVWPCISRAKELRINSMRSTAHPQRPYLLEELCPGAGHACRVSVRGTKSSQTEPLRSARPVEAAPGISSQISVKQQYISW